MTNLIKNGEFTEGEDNWSVTHPEHVRISDGECTIASPGSISQEVAFHSEVEEYALSAIMKTAPGFTTRVLLTLHPAGDELELTLKDASNWQVLTDWIIAPPGTTRATVTLQADGATGVAASQFGSLVLLSLNKKKPKNVPA